MEYNTTLKRLPLPEYGRNIQNMVDFCLTVTDRDERNHCANTIIGIMGNMFPHLRDVNDFKHILWDHLAIMSDFKLDVDYPYEVIKKDNLYKRPPGIPYDQKAMIYRHYGETLELLIDKASEMEEGDEKEVLIRLIANQMKKSYLVWNKDSVDNHKILKDLADLSEGRIIRNENTVKFADISAVIEPPPPPRSTKKNKKNHSRKGQ
jgi:hypothetical protein